MCDTVFPERFVLLSGSFFKVELGDIRNDWNRFKTLFWGNLELLVHGV